MIKFINLKDYQSHKDTKLTFHPGFNVIVGPSGNGKTAVIRAVQSLVFNTPGMAEVRWPDAKSYHVEIGVNDNVVERDKGTGVNSYTVNGGAPLVDVNRDVPTSVTSALGMKAVEIDGGTEIAIQFSDQMDSPFLLSEKDSDKMKFLNTLSGTNAVDLAAKEAAAKVKASTRTAKDAEAELEAILAQEKAFQEEYTKLHDYNKYLASELTQLKELEALKPKILKLQKKSNYLVSAYKHIKLVKEYLSDELISSTSELVSQYEKLLTTKQKYDSLKERYNSLKERKALFSSINVDETKDLIDRLIEYKKLDDKYTALKKAYQTNKAAKQLWENNYNTQANTYLETIAECGVCPVCENTLTDDCLEKIRKSL